MFPRSPGTGCRTASASCDGSSPDRLGYRLSSPSVRRCHKVVDEPYYVMVFGRERCWSAVEKGILRRHRAAGVDADDILRARRHHHDAIDERAKDDAVAGFRHGLAPL